MILYDKQYYNRHVLNYCIIINIITVYYKPMLWLSTVVIIKCATIMLEVNIVYCIHVL